MGAIQFGGIPRRERSFSPASDRAHTAMDLDVENIIRQALARGQGCGPGIGWGAVPYPSRP